MNTIFNSRDTFYRNPKYAVSESTRVHFKIVLPRSLNCSNAVLKVISDSDNQSFCNSMFWCGMKDDNHEMWECHFTPENYGLYWYHFEIETINGTEKITRDTNTNKALINQDGASWQLTVTAKDFQTPDWLCGGIMYQIFPDRFFNSGKKKTLVPKDRKIRKDWDGIPEFRPDENNQITNSDYFGGDLKGILDKLDYIESLGVNCIYLNPIFESHSNHRYDVADYNKIDPLLGSMADFNRLCKELKKRDMHLIIDGVFSHTGSDSIYFNKNNRYDTVGAYNSKDSQYYKWYKFSNWPEDYSSWWGFKNLPELEETNPEYNKFINGEDGIIRKWIKEGASGWRLDVADELPDSFIENLREAAKSENPDALILGEVWEDASNKESYSHRRKFLLGKQLDSVMNYPFKNAILGFLRGEDGGLKMEEILTIVENYPKEVTRNLMNPLGTHDTPRALTALVGERINGRGRDWQASQKLDENEKAHGIKLLKTAAAMQYTLPGVPCIYYGDETAMEGYKDPFNRKCYPWGNENLDMINWYKDLAKMRAKCPALKEGDIKNIYSDQDIIIFSRTDEKLKSSILCAFNSSGSKNKIVIPDEFVGGKALLNSEIQDNCLIIPPYGCAFIQVGKQTSVRRKPVKKVSSSKKSTVATTKSKSSAIKKETKQKSVTAKVSSKPKDKTDSKQDVSNIKPITELENQPKQQTEISIDSKKDTSLINEPENQLKPQIKSPSVELQKNVEVKKQNDNQQIDLSIAKPLTETVKKKKRKRR